MNCTLRRTICSFEIIFDFEPHNNQVTGIERNKKVLDKLISLHIMIE